MHSVFTEVVVVLYVKACIAPMNILNWNIAAQKMPQYLLKSESPELIVCDGSSFKIYTD